MRCCDIICRVDESSSEYETDTSADDEDGRGIRLKPIFVRKEARNTIAEAEALAAKEVPTYFHPLRLRHMNLETYTLTLIGVHFPCLLGVESLRVVLSHQS